MRLSCMWPLTPWKEIYEIYYSPNAEKLEEAIDQLANEGPPEHVWGILAPAAENVRLLYEEEGVHEEREMAQDDLNENARQFITEGG